MACGSVGVNVRSDVEFVFIKRSFSIRKLCLMFGILVASGSAASVVPIVVVVVVVVLVFVLSVSTVTVTEMAKPWFIESAENL